MPIIYQPNYLGDAVSQVLTSESIKQAREHDEDVIERKRRQRNTAIGLGAVAGGVSGLALGGASLAAGGTIPGLGLPALGTLTIPTTAIVPGLTGAALGGEIGERTAAEDYVGALGTGAQTAKLGVDYANNQRIYGYQPTREGRASAAALAAKAGTTIDQVEDIAKRRGIPAAQVLQEMRNEASDRALGEEYYQTLAHTEGVYDAATGERLGIQEDINNFPGHESVPDSQSFAKGQDQLDDIDANEAAYRQSGGRDGATYAEMRSSLRDVGRQIRTSARGHRQPQAPPNIGVDPLTGATVETPWGKPYYEDKNTLMVPRRDARGQINYFPKTVSSDPAEIISRLPEADQPVAINKYKRLHGAKPGTEDQYIFKSGGGIEQVTSAKTEAEIRAAYVHKILEPNANGEIIGAAEFNKALMNYDRASRSTKALDSLYEVHKDLGSVSPEKVQELRSQLNSSIPEAEWDADTKRIMEEIGVAALRNAIKEGRVVLPPQQPVELGARLQALKERETPEGQAQLQAAEAAKAAAEEGKKKTKKLESVVTGMEKKKQLDPEEKAMLANITARPDEPVILVKRSRQRGMSGLGRVGAGRFLKREDLAPVQERSSFTKAELTPEIMAALKARGWMIPGLDDEE